MSRRLFDILLNFQVFRHDSRKLPIGDPDVDWEETIYLNLIVHQLEYTITLAICSRTSPKDLQVKSQFTRDKVFWPLSEITKFFSTLRLQGSAGLIEIRICFSKSTFICQISQTLS